MKYFVIYTASFFILNTAIFVSITDVINAFKSGNVTQIVSFLDNSVEISFKDQNNTYNKSQATKVLSAFFNENKITDFKVLHQSESGGTAYCIGNLSTSGGTYRLTFFAKEKNGKTVLQEIRLEK